MGTTILFGGTFDPVHHGHLITARAALETMAARRVVLMPAWRSPHKLERDIAPGEHRLAMLQRAVEKDPAFVVDDLELQRTDVSFTIDTIEILRRRWPGERLVLLLGLDQLPALHTWHRVRELLERLDVAIVGRSGVEQWFNRNLQETLGIALAEKILANVLSTPVVDISATEIRTRVRAGQSIRYLVPEAVEQYIRERGLYRPGAAKS